MKIDPLVNLRTSCQAINLVAIYEELHHVPETECVTRYLAEFGAHCFKRRAGDSAISAAYRRALSAMKMSSRDFLQSDDFRYRGSILARMRNSMLQPDARLLDVLDDWPEEGFISVVHESGAADEIPVEDLRQLTAVGREEFFALLNARVNEIRCGDTAIEIVISGVDPQVLETFRDAHAAHQQAEQAMWLM